MTHLKSAAENFVTQTDSAEACVPAGDELAAWRRADGLNIVVLQLHTFSRQFVQSWSLDGRVMVADVVETLL